MNQRQRTIFDETVSSKIERLLARCEQLRRGSDCPRPTKFNRDGQRHAEQVARADQQRAQTASKGETDGRQKNF